MGDVRCVRVAGGSDGRREPLLSLEAEGDGDAAQCGVAQLRVWKA